MKTRPFAFFASLSSSWLSLDSYPVLELDVVKPPSPNCPWLFWNIQLTIFDSLFVLRIPNQEVTNRPQFSRGLCACGLKVDQPHPVVNTEYLIHCTPNTV